jgi:hypothetical protein
MDGQRLGVRLQPPRRGEHTDELLAAWATSAADRGAARQAPSVAWRFEPGLTTLKSQPPRGDEPMQRPPATRRPGAAGRPGRIARLARAQSDKPVRFILPNATGSGVDAITRAAQPCAVQGPGPPVVVDNQPGAGGIVGLQALARSPADGKRWAWCRTTW